MQSKKECVFKYFLMSALNFTLLLLGIVRLGDNLFENFPDY